MSHAEESQRMCVDTQPSRRLSVTLKCRLYGVFLSKMEHMEREVEKTERERRAVVEKPDNSYLSYVTKINISSEKTHQQHVASIGCDENEPLPL